MTLEELAQELAVELKFSGTIYSPSPKTYNWHIRFSDISFSRYSQGELNLIYGYGNSLQEARKNLVSTIKGSKVYLMRYNGERVLQTMLREYRVPKSLKH